MTTKRKPTYAELEQRIAELEQELTEAHTRIDVLTTPVSDEEWKRFVGVEIDEMAERRDVDALIASRAVKESDGPA